MLTREDLNVLYEWAKDTKFPCKKAPTIDGYSNKIIDYYWLKSVKKSTIIRQKYMSDEVYEIYKNDEILFSNYTSFRAGTELYPHRDPDILRYPYKRIQIPLNIPCDRCCYMEWTKITNGRIKWEEGKPEVCDVMNNTHQAFNKSDKAMDFLFVDVKLDTEVMINN